MLLSYGDDTKKSQLTSELFYEDQPGRMDVVDFGDAARNNGLFTRPRFTRGSRLIDMIGRIHADIFFQSRYLLNEVNVKIKLVRSRNTFCLIGANEFRVKIKSAIMFVRKVKLAPSVFLAHAKALENSTAKYPIRRAVCKMVTIPNTFRDINIEKLFSGQLPSRLVIGLVANATFNGANNRNPFNFAHYNLMEISVYTDGQQQYGMKTLLVRTLLIHFTYARTTPYSPELEKYLRTKEMGFRGPHFHRDTLCTLSTYHQIWRRKTTLTYKSRVASGSC